MSWLRGGWKRVQIASSPPQTQHFNSITTSCPHVSLAHAKPQNFVQIKSGPAFKAPTCGAVRWGRGPLLKHLWLSDETALRSGICSGSKDENDNKPLPPIIYVADVQKEEKKSWQR